VPEWAFLLIVVFARTVTSADASVVRVQSSDKNVFVKLGAYAWLAGAILFTEVLIIIKFGRGEFTAPFPERVKLAWGAFGATLAAILVVWQLSIWARGYLRKTSPQRGGKKQA
jgi:hypothetical protein